MDTPRALLRPLLTPRIQTVVERLYRETLAEDPAAREAASKLGLFSDADAGFYPAMRNARLPVVPEFAALLHVLARTTGARLVVEFGTSFGVSTICLAAALRDNGGGRVVTTELVPEKARQAHLNLVEAGLEDLVDIRVGDARSTLADAFDRPIDMLFLDATKGLYLQILKLVEPQLRAGALVISDRSDLDEDPTVRDAGYLAYLGDTANGYRFSSVGTRALGRSFEHAIAVRC